MLFSILVFNFSELYVLDLSFETDVAFLCVCVCVSTLTKYDNVCTLTDLYLLQLNSNLISFGHQAYLKMALILPNLLIVVL